MSLLSHALPLTLATMAYEQRLEEVRAKHEEMADKCKQVAMHMQWNIVHSLYTNIIGTILL